MSIEEHSHHPGGIPLVACFLFPRDGHGIGNKHYFVQSIFQARSRNPHASIFVITNGAFLCPLGDNIHVVAPEGISDFDRRFMETYVHRSKAHKLHFLTSAFRRLFLIRDLMASRGIKRCFHFESDVFLYAKVDDFIGNFDSQEMAYCVADLSNTGAWLINGIDSVEQLLSLILSYYDGSNDLSRLASAAPWHRAAVVSGLIDAIKNDDATEMHFLSLFWHANSRRVGDLSSFSPTGFFDRSVHDTQDGNRLYECVDKRLPEPIQIKATQCKKLYAKDGMIYCRANRKFKFGKAVFTFRNTFARLLSIHAGSNEKWMSQYYAVDNWPTEMRAALEGKKFVDLTPERRYFESRLHLIPEFRDISIAAELARISSGGRAGSSFLQAHAQRLKSKI